MGKYFKFVGAAALTAAIALGVAGFTPAQAATQADLEAKIKVLEQSLNQLKTQLTEVKVQQTQQADVQQSYLQAAADKMPKWLERISFYGDLRMRYQHTSYDDLNGKSKNDRDRFRFRLRFGVKSQIHEDVEIGFRLVTGADDDPTSTNQTFTNFFSEKGVGFDRAYVKYTPSFVPDKGLEFTFGKAKNPFLTTKAIWDGDVVPEGAFLKYTAMKASNIQPFILGSVMFVDEHSNSSQNAYAVAGQIGVTGKAGAFKYAVATAYTDWGKFGDANNVPDGTNGNPTYVDSDGATRLSKFKVWDLYAKLGYKINKETKVGLHGQYLKNTDATGPYDGKDTGWLVGGDISYAKFKFKAWYKNIEANATPGFIADSDSGFVNRKGIVLGIDYKLFKYGVLQLSYFNTKPIDDNISGASNGDQTFFADFVFKF